MNIIGAVPYVWTRASQGVLHGIEGLQDLTLAAKFSAFEKDRRAGALRTIAVVLGGHSADQLQPGAAAALDRLRQHARVVARHA